MSTHSYFSLSARPTCPSILIPFDNQLYALPAHKLEIEAEFNVSTAFVKIVGTWKNIAKYKSDCMFVLPTRGTVTSVNIDIGHRYLETAVIPKEDAAKVQAKQALKNPNPEGNKEVEQGQLPPDMSYDEYIPNLFRLPIQGVESKDLITVTCKYIEPLDFYDGAYHFRMPLKLGSNLIPTDKTMADIIQLKCRINSVSGGSTFECKTHKIAQTGQEFPSVELMVSDFNSAPQDYEQNMRARLQNQPGMEEDVTALQGPSASNSVDFELAYSLSSEQILSTLINEPAGNDKGAFLLFVTPPSIDNLETYFIRHMVFLIDRSGSMNGDPFEEATRALGVALQGLKPTDKFTIIAFDHTQNFFAEILTEATPNNVERACTWIRTLQPERGGTDIQTPLEWALRLFANPLASPQNNAFVLPFVVLLTDGCVQTEREICRFAKNHCGDARILTIGIGSYCNWFFLKMLAQIGRGFSDVVVYKEKIFEQVVQLLDMASVPVLTNVTLDVSGCDIELYPFPIPDLFMGAPLTISGQYTGRFPQTIQLKAMQGEQVYQITVTTRTSDVIPVAKVFIKQRLDLLTAKAWLDESKKIEKEVTTISCEESMPTAYTTMVAYETERPEENKDDDEGTGLLKKKLNQQKLQKDKKKWSKKKKVAALAAGNLIVVGAVAFSFGDIAASGANLPVVGSLGDSLGGGDGVEGCCADCDCDCECGDCLAC